MAWCYKNNLQNRALEMAHKIRLQLTDCLKETGRSTVAELKKDLDKLNEFIETKV